jgi:hypothetical protein
MFGKVPVHFEGFVTSKMERHMLAYPQSLPEPVKTGKASPQVQHAAYAVPDALQISNSNSTQKHCFKVL